MYKVQWDEVANPFKHCFAICNYESALSLYFNLQRSSKDEATASGSRPINIKLCDLSGNEIQIHDLAAAGEWTHK